MMPPNDVANHPELRQQSLWDRAYDSLKDEDSNLIGRYENLLTRELLGGLSPLDMPTFFVFNIFLRSSFLTVQRQRARTVLSESVMAPSRSTKSATR